MLANLKQIQHIGQPALCLNRTDAWPISHDNHIGLQRYARTFTMLLLDCARNNQVCSMFKPVEWSVILKTVVGEQIATSELSYQGVKTSNGEWYTKIHHTAYIDFCWGGVSMINRLQTRHTQVHHEVTPLTNAGLFQTLVDDFVQRLPMVGIEADEETCIMVIDNASSSEYGMLKDLQSYAEQKSKKDFQWCGMNRELLRLEFQQGIIHSDSTKESSE